ncbi:MAG TPA: sigma-70 family RNA polymerase sigma factor [Patescibacteria group bacterium]|nr:sigma-70 family RNA polymerase sigma factor [Patescibacteria group bacterium]
MDEQAIISLYKTYAPHILRYLKNHLPQEIAQEILNDVFMDAVDSYPMLRDKKNLKTWLYKIAHNKTVDYYRKKKIKSFLLSQIPYLDLIAAELQQPEFILEKNKIRDRIETTMKNISQKYRNILHMHYEEQIPIKQIALVLHLSPKATESLLYRARQQFIKLYERT